MFKRIFFTILGLAVLIGGLVFVKGLQFKDLAAAGEAAVMPPSAVTAAYVETTEWETTLSALGTLEAAQGVVISVDSPGRISKLYFDGGETVKKGDLLIEQEATSETAQLSAAESDLVLAQSNLDRVARLYRGKIVSRSEFDAAKSSAQAAQAQVDNITSSLNKKQITAPFDGRLGLRLVDIGQDLTPGVPIVSLQAIDPMRINFSLPQQALGKIKDGFTVRVSTDVIPDKVFTGSITAINTEIDQATRTVRVQATLDRPADDQGAGALLPGMFASVEVVLPGTRPVLMIPLTAVSFASYGDSVFVLEPASKTSTDGSIGTSVDTSTAANDSAAGNADPAANGDPENNGNPSNDNNPANNDAPSNNSDSANNGDPANEGDDSDNGDTTGNDDEQLIARQQFVQLGERRGDFVEVLKGIEDGMQIANDGVFKLRPGAPVMITETGTSPDLAPAPDNS